MRTGDVDGEQQAPHQVRLGTLRGQGVIPGQSSSPRGLKTSVIQLFIVSFLEP